LGYYFLQLVKQLGGIPRQTSTNQGSKTIHMAGHQINLTKQYNTAWGLDSGTPPQTPKKKACGGCTPFF
jgi:hypothetical protein